MSSSAELMNNSINDNKLNARKSSSSSSTLRQIKNLIKCILKKNNKNTYVKNPQPNFYYNESEEEDEVSDNFANEILENEIFEEIDECDDFAAVPVYDEDGHMDFMPVTRGQRYIPVHFAKTEAGTFFWTSMTHPDDSDIAYNAADDKNTICNYQTPEIQVPCDRWAQA